MKTYDVNWNGLDRGHEGAWSPDVWRDVLNAIAKYSPVNLDDTTGQFYTELATKQPGTQWVTVSPAGDTRTFFRDGREPWASTGVVSFNKGAKTATLTSVGRQVVEGVISYADVLASAALGTEEKGDHPFEIILDAMRRAPSGVGLAYEDVVKVMRHYRSGDDIAEVLNSPNEIISANSGRRLKAILLLMTYAGLAVHKGNLYYAGQDVTALRTLTGMDLREAFKNWIMENNAEGSGKAATYITALEDADIIAQAFNEKFKLPSVYEMSDASLESLRDFIANEQNLESHAAGSSVLNGVAGLHGKSYWDGGHCRAAISALLEFKRNLREEKSKSLHTAASQLLTVALKLFANSRKQLEWCADNTDGNTSKPRAGYVANLQLRKFLNDAQTQSKLAVGDAGNVRAWFKEYWDPDTGKNWLGDLTDAELKDFGPYVCDLIQPSAHKPPRPPKFSLSLEAAVKTVIRPGENCFYDKRVHEALKFLGLMDGEFDPDFSDEDYQLAKSAQIVLKRRLKKLIPNGQVVEWDAAANPPAAKENNQEPDFLTVNEFLWFVVEKMDLIKEEIMSQKMKKPSIAIKAGTKTIADLIGLDPDSMMSRLTAALLTKPFAILAGASGTGKSRMVRQLAYMTCLNTDLQEEAKDATAPGNYRLVQVKPNWHDSSDLLGYRSAINEGTYVTTDFVKFVLKAHAYPDTPFFVCLDEMNLAPVEQYFAEFLSASEDVKKADDGKTLVSAALIKPSDFGGDVLNLEPEYELAADRKAIMEKIGLFIPHNLYVVGTVNMDDTTCQFSRKVLDRAMTIEMNEVKLETLQKKDVMTFDHLLLTEPEIKMFAERAEFDGTKLDEAFRGKLETLRGDLESSPFAIAYRFAREAVVYREAIARLGNDAAKAAKDEITLDHMALMKILPRITGTTSERKGVTDKLSAFFTKLNRPLSLKKLNEMIAAASGNGEYLSFWP